MTTQENPGATEPCDADACLLALAAELWTTRRTHGGQIYLVDRSSGETIDLSGRSGRSNWQSMLSFAHRKHHPRHAKPSNARIKAAIGHLGAAAQEVPCDPEPVAEQEQADERVQLRVEDDPESITKLRELIDSGGLPSVYLMSESLVRIERSPSPHRDVDVTLPMRATPLDPPLVQLLVAQHVDARRLRNSGAWARYNPSIEHIKAATSGSDWQRVPALRGLIGAPVLRPDWSLLQEPGYDQSTGLYLSPALDMQPIPEKPNRDAVQKARNFLLNVLLGEFPWVGPADKANMLGGLFTPYVRVALRAQTSPLLVITATMRSSGKSNLSNMIGMLVGQQIISWPSGLAAEVELEKLITSAFTRSAGAVIFDNLDNGATIDSPTLARLLTAGTWSGRLLGTNRMVSFPNDREWIATGNNLLLAEDIPTRSILVGLEPQDEHPEERTGFKIPDLEDWLRKPENRAQVLRAILILIIDWVNAGAKPDRDIAAMRGWTSLVQGIGGILAHHEIGGYLSNVNTIREADEGTAKWARFYTAWIQKYPHPVRAKELFDSADHVAKGMYREKDPWDGAFITGTNGRPPGNAEQLGTWLNAERKRWRGGYRAVGLKDRKGFTWWSIERAAGAPDPSDDEPAPLCD
ncbi:MAG: hypothetical protein JNL54_03360 [Kineosporiaceae bacterium]|nr:hypothetical protein [Kineosporiaceae bacterium]